MFLVIEVASSGNGCWRLVYLQWNDMYFLQTRIPLKTCGISWLAMHSLKILHSRTSMTWGRCNASADNKLSCEQQETSLSSCNWCSKVHLRRWHFCYGVTTIIFFYHLFQYIFEWGNPQCINVLLSWYDITRAWTYYIFHKFHLRAKCP